jgi:hypothetical protein
VDKLLFKELLKKAGLSKKELAALLDIPYATANSWGNNGRDFPYWVESWLNLYIENKACKELKKLMRESGLCNE